LNVQDILSKKSPTVITISPSQTLSDASQLLVEHNIGAVVVVDEAQNPIGILSERDIIRWIAQQGANALTQKVKAAMTTDLIVAVPDDDLAYLSNVMTDKRIRHLPIMQGNSLIGIVSIGDIVKAQLDYFAAEARHLELYIAGGYA
jgi:CBS domain-containing protein